MKTTILLYPCFLLIVLLFVSSCEDAAEPPIKIPSEWKETTIPADDWKVSFNKGDRLALMSDEVYIEIDEEENIVSSIDLPRYTRIEYKPLITQDYLVFGYERVDTSLRFGSEFIIELRATNKNLVPVSIKYEELLGGAKANMLKGPIAAINNQNQVLFHFDLWHLSTMQYYLFDIREQGDSLKLDLVKEFQLDGENDF